MFKSVIHFFRQKNIRNFLLNKQNCIFPDVSKYPVVAVFINENQKSQLKELEKTMNRLFVMKKCTFFIFEEKLAGDIFQNDKVHLVVKDDFNILGLLKQDKKDALANKYFDMLINLSKDQSELLTYDYLMSCIKTSFRVTFSNTKDPLYDLVIDSKKDESLISQLEILQKYLLMLSGKK